MLSFYLLLIDNDRDRKNFENIYNTYHDYMLKTAYFITQNHFDAEDALSDAMLSIVKHISKIDIDNRQKLKAYIHTVTKNAAIDIIRKRNSRREVNLDSIQFACSDSDIEENIANDDDYNTIVLEIRKMPQAYRDVLLLYYVFHHSVKSISEELHMNISTVKTCLRRGIQILKKNLSGAK